MVEHRSPKPGVGGSRPSTPARPDSDSERDDGTAWRTGNQASQRARRTSTRPSLGEFFRQVRQEAAKVTWPTRKETLITTAMVFVMSILAAVFFLVVDGVLSSGRATWCSGCRRLMRNDRAVVRDPRLLGLREEGRAVDQGAGPAEGHGRPDRGGPGADRGGGRGAQGQQEGQRRAQVLPGLRAGEDGDDRRDLAPGQEHAEGDRLPGRAAKPMPITERRPSGC